MQRKVKRSRGVGRARYGQLRYAWGNTLRNMLRQPVGTLLTVLVIAIALTLPSICYLLWKNVSEAATKWYPVPQLTIYLDKSLNDKAAETVIQQVRGIPGVGTVNYLSREEALNEFRSWSGFGSALNLLEENPLPAVAIITPKLNFQSAETLPGLRERLAVIAGVEDVRLDDSWFARLAALSGLVAKVAGITALLMVVAVFLVIGNSVRLMIFSRRDTILVMKLIGATDSFILLPFLNGGALLGALGALVSLLSAQILIWSLQSLVAQVAQLFGAVFHLQGLAWDEALLLLLIAAMIGWFSAWLATARHLQQFSPK